MLILNSCDTVYISCVAEIQCVKSNKTWIDNLLNHSLIKGESVNR